MIAYFKCRPAGNPNLSGFVAWCGFKPLTANDANRERQEPIFFEFGRTEAETISRLQKGLDKQGVTEWRRQPV